MPQWTKQMHTASQVQPPTITSEHIPDSDPRWRAMLELDQSGIFEPLGIQSSSLSFQALVRNLALDLYLKGENPQLCLILNALIEGPAPWISAEAALLLDTLCPTGRGAGSAGTGTAIHADVPGRAYRLQASAGGTHIR